MKYLKYYIQESLINKNTQLAKNQLSIFNFDFDLFKLKFLEKDDFGNVCDIYKFTTDTKNHQILYKKIRKFVKNPNNFIELKQDLERTYHINDITLNVNNDILSNGHIQVNCLSQHDNQIHVWFYIGNPEPYETFELFSFSVSPIKKYSDNKILIEIGKDKNINNLSEPIDIGQFADYVLNYLYNKL